jgi:hypothetical protein
LLAVALLWAENVPIVAETAADFETADRKRL